MLYDYLLNQVTLKDGRKYVGIVDYVTTKQIYFFDFTGEASLDYTLLSIMWKGNHADMRFSVYCAIEHPNIQLPNVILIPQNNIDKILGNYDHHEKPKQRKRIIKASYQS